MGKGDKKTKKGKIAIGSFGVRRPKKKSSSAVVADKPKKTAKKAKPVKKTKK